MWKKDEEQPVRQTTEQPRPKTQATTPNKGSRATIGPSITICGDVTGSEDLLIQGSVDGSVLLEEHALAVGSQGRVSANITARVITIEGEVKGDLTAQEQIALLGTARVQGDIKAPRVVLEDGASFRGLVDMGASPSEGRARSSAAKPATGGASSDEGPQKSSGAPTPGGSGGAGEPSSPQSKQRESVATKGGVS